MSVYSPCLSTACAFALAGEKNRSRMSLLEKTSGDAERHEQNEQDSLLLQRMARGDRQAFADLYDRFSRPLYATAVRILNDAKEAEDIVQDVFIALWQKSSDFESSRGTAFSWAVTLTRNRAIDRIRQRTRRSELLSQSAPEDLGYDEPAGGDSVAHLECGETATAVRAAVANLPAEQQLALQLAFFSGLTQQEIASRLREPLGTVKARIRRGLLKLRDTLAPRT